MGAMKTLNVKKMMGRGPGARRGSFGVTQWFFDAPKVARRLDVAERKVLSRFGSFVRRTMKSSIRKRKRAAKTGEPPSSHVGLLRRFIFFAWDPSRRSVVIGPERLHQKTGGVPELLEKGGTRVLKKDTVMRVGGPGRDARGRFTLGQRKVVPKGTRLRYAARPYAEPALKKELPKLSGMWAGAVKT